MTIRADNSLVDKILELPEAPVLLDRLKSALAKEQKKRLDFYEQVSEMEKSEFIKEI